MYNHIVGWISQLFIDVDHGRKNTYYTMDVEDDWIKFSCYFFNLLSSIDDVFVVNLKLIFSFVVKLILILFLFDVAVAANSHII